MSLTLYHSVWQASLAAMESAPARAALKGETWICALCAHSFVARDSTPKFLQLFGMWQVDSTSLPVSRRAYFNISGSGAFLTFSGR
jgi:hypothetical protein